MPLIIVYIFYKLAVTTLSMIKVLRNCATKEHNTKERWEKILVFLPLQIVFLI
jgi:hypothetical protein